MPQSEDNSDVHPHLDNQAGELLWTWTLPSSNKDGVTDPPKVDESQNNFAERERRQ
jgi:hypothetical protein